MLSLRGGKKKVKNVRKSSKNVRKSSKNVRKLSKNVRKSSKNVRKSSKKNNKIQLTLEHYKNPGFSVDRSKIKNYYVSDIHCHFRSFGKYNIDYETFVNWMINLGMLFCVVTGIGQRLPLKSRCRYYGDCDETEVKPSITNDIININNLYTHFYKYKDKIELILSITCLDFNNPKKSYNVLKFLLGEYKNKFKSCGEINLCKQAIKSNNVPCTAISNVIKLKKTMELLKKNKIPIVVHCDLGNNEKNLKFLKLITKFINTYKNNKIIWAHMGGISKELTNLNTKKHISILENFLNKYKNLYIDMSWGAVGDIVFKTEKQKESYSKLINKYSKQFLSGSDFVASSDKTLKTYTSELKNTSIMFEYIDDNAFENIVLGKNFIKLYKLNYNVPCLNRKCKYGH